MAALIPYGLMAASAIPGLISGIMGIADRVRSGGRLRMARRKRGGRVRRHKRYHHRRMRHHGRGAVADTLGSLPLIGALLGPLAKAFGGRLRRHHMMRHRRRRGHGLSPMYIRRPYVGMGLAPYGAHRRIGYGGALIHRKGYYKHVHGHRIHVRPTIVHKARGLAPMYMRRPYVGRGLLAPAGGMLHHRRGYYKHVHGHRIHVRPTMVHKGRGALMITLPGYKKKGY